MNPYTARKLVEAGSFAPRSGPLSALNLGFHETYNRLVNETVPQFGDSIPVIVMIGDYVSLLNDGGERTERMIPERYHQLKSLSHIAFGLQLCLMANGEGELRDETSRELREKLSAIESARAALSDFPADEQVSPTKVLNLSQEVIDRTLEHGAVNEGQLQEYANSIAPLVIRNASFAVRLELDRLHALVSEWRQEIGDAKWQDLYIVICDYHQPRYRHAALQYFDRILQEREGIGGELEERIVFGERVLDIEGALDLLARHVIDQRASQMIFGDRRRLQKDVLADVAAEYLDVLLPQSK